MGGEEYPGTWVEFPVVQWVPGASQPSVWPPLRKGWLDLPCSLSCCLVKDSDWFLSSSGWAKPIVFLCFRPLIVVLAFHGMCSGMSGYKSKEARPGHRRASGSVWQLPKGEEESFALGSWSLCCGYRLDVADHLCHEGAGCCCQLLLPKLSVAFLQSCSSLRCPSACPAVWISLSWRAVSLLFGWICTEPMAPLSSLYLTSWALGILGGNGSTHLATPSATIYWLSRCTAWDNLWTDTVSIGIYCQKHDRTTSVGILKIGIICCSNRTAL